MSLATSAFKNDLKAIFTLQYEGDLSSEQESKLDDLCDSLSSKMEDYIKTATVLSGIAVTVNADTGVGTTTGTGSLE